MSDVRLKSEVWIKAQLRVCDVQCLPAVIARRGDADAGQVLIKVIKSRDACELLASRFDDQGRKAWMIVMHGGEGDCDAYIQRETNVDPDLWVLEIEDPQNVYRPDGEKPKNYH